MATEQFANAASSTLNGAILAGAGSLVVTSAASFPTVGQFRILVESEIMLVTGVSGTTFTVSRGQEGTTDAGHGNGATVTQILTAGALGQLKADVPRPVGAVIPLVAGTQYSVGTVYTRLGTGFPVNLANIGIGTPAYVLKAVVDIPASSTAQIQLYDVNSHAAVWTSGVISGPQTGYSVSQNIALTGSVLLEFWLATPTNTGGQASCSQAAVLAAYS